MKFNVLYVFGWFIVTVQEVHPVFSVADDNI
jgi:hypothetical protein